MRVPPAALAILATLCLVSSNARADAVRMSASSFGGRTLRIERVSSSVCALGLQASFAGRKDARTGVISGTWSYTGSTTCSLQMLRLDVQASALFGSNIAGTAPPMDCRLCKGVMTAASLYCTRCNGTWTIRSEHDILLPVAALLVGVPPGCQRSLTAIHCMVQVAVRLF